jgi:hypothetical protein
MGTQRKEPLSFQTATNSTLAHAGTIEFSLGGCRRGPQAQTQARSARAAWIRQWHAKLADEPLLQELYGRDIFSFRLTIFFYIS